ncbi:GIY-YIG nuclease family protein [Cyanobium sp. PCC 7001]|uniref:GIY-YIG nuclease family protein n=1 Tax=Cyanobium sp. PCC 7001 TaxID=180281 RepID=UPI0005B86A08|nr:GIY-YIG nuclease family protein [Cyanobium sp. PCC 7001]
MNIVYVLSNPAMPGLVKIGKTNTTVEERMASLNGTSIPFPFECEYACTVSEGQDVEAALHFAFGDHRVNPNREFFELMPERVVAVLKLLALEDVTPSVSAELQADPTDKAAAERFTRKRRPPLNFHEMGLANGAVLTWDRDPSISATVCGPKRVAYNGEELAISRLTGDLFGSSNYVNPGPYWNVGGRLLRDIYNDTYDPIDE